MQLNGKVVLVTGASRGIGAAVARECAARGAVVAGSGRDAQALEAVLTPIGGTAMVGDVRDEGHADRMVTDVVDRHGRLDVVVVNAGVGHAGALSEMGAARIDELIDVDVRAPLQLARAAVPHLTAQTESALVFVTSIAGALLVPQEAVYSASKACVEAFAEVLREELRGSGTTVSTVLPGAVATEFFDRRGLPYDRKFPRPIPAQKVAQGVVRAIEDSVDRVVVPGWLRLPMVLRQLAPRGYRALSRRYG